MRFSATPIPVVPSTTPCHAWVSAVTGNGALERAERVFREVEQKAPILTALRTTPQSAPWHAEGPFVVDHIHRMLATLYAVGDGASLAEIEEFAREKDLALEVAGLTEVLRAHQAILAAFAVLHDIAKPSTVFVDAGRDTKGAAEGFVQHKSRGEHLLTDAERIRYDKLYRAFALQDKNRTPSEMMGAFYDAYGIAVHYDRHDAVAASPAYADDRHRVAVAMGLSSSQEKMLTELVRYHIDTIHAFNERADRVAYAILVARAGKAGLNVEQFLDLALAALFLDAVAGSLHYAHGTCRAQTPLVVHMLRAEREAMPGRHEAREMAQLHAAKSSYKALLAEAGLDGESVFTLLGTPIGPVRGTVMARVQSLMDNPDAAIDFGEHTGELRRRIARLRELERTR